jgi:hypothetical protein
MSFDINPIGEKPVIRESASTQDGGAGNLGYFEQEDGEKKKNEKAAESIFSEAKSKDTFSREGEDEIEDEPFSFAKFIAQIILFLKDTFYTIIGKKKS